MKRTWLLFFFLFSDLIFTGDDVRPSRWSADDDGVGGGGGVVTGKSLGMVFDGVPREM